MEQTQVPDKETIILEEKEEVYKQVSVNPGFNTVILVLFTLSYPRNLAQDCREVASLWRQGS